MRRILVLISGGGSNLHALLEATGIHDSPARIVAVGADRQAAGLAHAEHAGVPTFVVPFRDFPDRASWGAELLQQVQQWQPDLVVLAGFMRILPAEVVDALSPRLINTHPALLPKYPGAHGVRDALADGATVTGVTVHIVDAGVDTGPILAQRSLQMLPDDTEQSLHERIKVIERQLLTETVLAIAADRIQLAAIAAAATEHPGGVPA